MLYKVHVVYNFYLFSFRCCFFFLKAFFTLSSKNAARSIVRLGLGLSPLDILPRYILLVIDLEQKQWKKNIFSSLKDIIRNVVYNYEFVNIGALHFKIITRVFIFNNLSGGESFFSFYFFSGFFRINEKISN